MILASLAYGASGSHARLESVGALEASHAQHDRRSRVSQKNIVR